MPWTPSLNDLCNENKLESVMIKFLRSLTKTKFASKNNAQTYFVSAYIHTLLAKDKSQLKTALSLLLNELTRRKELVNVTSDLGICIP